MPPPHRPRFPSGARGLEWLVTDDGSRTLWNNSLGECYHSGCGAATESLSVYLLNSGIAGRLQQGRPSRVLEFGLGTGTALLLTAALAECMATQLHYAAMESEMLPAPLYRELGLAQQLAASPPSLELLNRVIGSVQVADYTSCLSALSAQFAAAIEHLDSHEQTQEFRLGKYTTLKLALGDALQTIAIDEPPRDAFDAVYFDPFSPETCPELWQPHVFRFTHSVLRPGGCWVSYCVKSRVRKELEAVGFEIEKLSGPAGGKREVLRATRPWR